MTDIASKTAFVTGAASGIGLALTKALLARGAKVMMADMNAKGLKSAQASLGSPDNTATIVCDVSDAASVQAAAKATTETFGKVHLLFNNAGVSLAGLPGQINLADWRWITDINLMGVVYGVETFLPLISSHGEGGHIINTASMAGHVTTIGMGPYFATKFAVVGYSEALHAELSRIGIGVSCLCPTWVKTNIHNTSEKSPGAGENKEAFKSSKAYQTVKSLIENGMAPDTYAELTMKSIQANRLHVFNDPNALNDMRARYASNLADYEACLSDLGLA